MMDFLGILKDLNWALISQYMVIELVIGAIAGLIFKQVKKISASRNPNLQVISSKDYTSQHFAKNFPRHSFDIFRLPPEFVIVQSEDEQLISEDFYTFLGSSVQVFYENGAYKEGSCSALKAPVYIFTVMLPIFIGFFPTVLSLPFIGKTGNLMLYSGAIWAVLLFYIQPLLEFLMRSRKHQPHSPSQEQTTDSRD
jgi:hypothetical protein